MRIIEGLENCRACGISAALGTFDGMHIGHTAVIENAAAYAKKHPGVTAAVISVVRNNSGVLQTSRNFEKMLCERDIELLIRLSLSEIKDISAQSFFEDILVSRLGIKNISCGFNCRFGKDAAGDITLLEKLCRENGIDFQACEPLKSGGETVSSTAIREALALGNIKKANSMLGRRFSFDFTVVSGDKLGRKLGAPTINQPFPEGFILPRFGVYASAANINGKDFCAVTNIGVRPTLTGRTLPRAESYIIGYSGDLYGKNIEVSLYEFLRDERKFPSLDELKKAIKHDADTSLKVFSDEKGRKIR